MEIKEKVLRGFPISRRRCDFWDGGDGEADQPAGPRRARDSRHGGRPRRWGGTRGCRLECGRCRRDSRHARRGWERETVTRVSKGENELSWTVLKTRVIY
jgi:hypothetical protein